MAFAGMLSDEDIKAAVLACQSESAAHTQLYKVVESDLVYFTQVLFEEFHFRLLFMHFHYILGQQMILRWTDCNMILHDDYN